MHRCLCDAWWGRNAAVYVVQARLRELFASEVGAAPSAVTIKVTPTEEWTGAGLLAGTQLVTVVLWLDSNRTRVALP